MFNISFGEIILILVVFIITIEPSKFKEYLALIRFFYFKFHNLKNDILEQIGFLEKPEKYVLGDDGKKYESYDITNIFKTDSETESADPEEGDKPDTDK